MDKTSKNILAALLFVIIFYLLKVLSSILLPFALALLLAIIFHPFVEFLKKLKLPHYLIYPVVTVITLGIIYALLLIIIQTSSELFTLKDYLLMRLSLKLKFIVAYLNGNFGLYLDSIKIEQSIAGIFSSEWLSTTAASLAATIGTFSGSFVMFGLYYIFLMGGMSNYKKYLLYVGADKGEALLASYEKIRQSINSYIYLKALINLGMGCIVILICLIFGIKFPLFWGLTALILNFIPNIGSIIMVGGVVVMGLIQFDSLNTVIILFLLLFGSNFFIGNFIEPKIMGNKLNLNILTVIFGLVFWGWLWGVTGMIISVPMLVILKSVFSQFPGLKIISRIMGYSPGE